MTALSELNRRKERMILPTWECTRISRYVKQREGNDLSCGGVIVTCYSTEGELTRYSTSFIIQRYAKRKGLSTASLSGEGWTKPAQS